MYMTFSIIDMDFLYQFNLRLIAPLFTVSFHEMFEKKKKYFKIFKSWQVCDWLAKWIIMLGFMDLRWPRVFRRSSVGLVYHSSTLRCYRKLKSPIMDVKEPFILHSQCRSCWWLGDARSQGISNHGIDLLIPGYSSFSIRKVTHWGLNKITVLQSYHKFELIWNLNHYTNILFRLFWASMS